MSVRGEQESGPRYSRGGCNGHPPTGRPFSVRVQRQVAQACLELPQVICTQRRVRNDRTLLYERTSTFCLRSLQHRKSILSMRLATANSILRRKGRRCLQCIPRRLKRLSRGLQSTNGVGTTRASYKRKGGELGLVRSHWEIV